MARRKSPQDTPTIAELQAEIVALKKAIAERDSLLRNEQEVREALTEQMENHRRVAEESTAQVKTIEESLRRNQALLDLLRNAVEGLNAIVGCTGDLE